MKMKQVGKLLSATLWAVSLLSLLSLPGAAIFAQENTRVTRPANPEPSTPARPKPANPRPKPVSPRPAQPAANTATPGKVRVPDQLELPEMITLDSGKFTMGCAEKGDAAPQHSIDLNGFLISKTPVTNRQFRQFVDYSGYVTEAEKASGDNGRINWRTFAVDRDDYPVVWVTWNDALAYCQWLTQMLQLKNPQAAQLESESEDGSVEVSVVEPIRLPTEAEWEYAARGGLEGKPYPWGENADETVLNCKWSENERKDGIEEARKYIKPVGYQTPNKFGLQDMAGNVMQWCYDWYAPDYYKNSPPRSPFGPEQGSERIARGGSWLQPPEACRVTSRHHFAPNQPNAQLGFRIVRSLPQKIEFE